ncbi:RNA polymerase factor sigma-54 [Psychroflexus sp. ALD_RP9]|uniref:RNA polymerase factor sigma-54 n=1 Tax=Psychroflexus sp. ALD_RP9 TaxID=2777186 RepID=UPI001A8E1811|nr:RNA polymerase factor sigma-54 [Psychroflexus sp. ALD_RP9]QSS97783.1 RNA polymerase factor sigma-54 [Psychroflexus sp. ALD_RP9]
MLKQQLNLKLSQKLSPQQIQLMKLIQLPTVAFEQRLRNELEENPALESGKDEYEDDEFKNEEYDNDSEVIETEFDVDDYLSDDEIPSYKLKANNYSKDSEDNQIPYASGISFTQYLKNQLHTINLNEEDMLIAEFLIGSVDSSGYLRRKLIDIVDDLAFTQNIFTSENHVLSVLNIVQTLDPAGVCSRDLQECLSLQLERKTSSKEVDLAKQIVNEAFNMFSKKHYEKLITKFSVSEEELKSAIEVIEHLNPKPGASYSSNTRIVEHVIPDFTIRIKNGELELTLNGRNAPEMHVSHEYANMLKAYKESNNKSKSQKEAVLFIKQKLDSAKWFIDAIKQRQHTLISTMTAIMNYQKDYFLSGDETDIKPMILKDIAEKIDMDISTVSRVANSKYVDTPYGTFLIKEFFSESMKNDQGIDVSTREIKNILESVVDKENKKKPYTDAKLTELLKEKGYPIARRTVAKYREQLDIPVARLRKEI